MIAKTPALTALVVTANALLASSSPTAAANPLVQLSYGSFEGIAEGKVQRFYGMPFAAPPLVFTY